MKLVIIGDTHGNHRKVTLPKGDVLLHVGDLCNSLNSGISGQVKQIKDVDDWFGEQAFEKVICIAGNHDFPFERSLITTMNNAIYLENEHYTYNGVKFFGSPFTPHFYGAFNAGDLALDEIFSKIDDDTDVVLTHGPPYGILDNPRDGAHAGCQCLKTEIDRVKPKVHAFGHIHDSYGIFIKRHTTFVNAALAGRAWIIEDNIPIEVEI